MTKTTLLTNVYNEEYLLPFWLNHHKDMFDEIIVVDYNSTDKSLEICKSICPNCKIITTRNSHFDAVQIDVEFMDIENNIDGIKIVLNTTEFLFCETSVKDLFKDADGTKVSYGIKAVSPYSLNNYNIENGYELLSNLLNDDVVYHLDRIGERYIHNYPNGEYGVGRHTTRNPTTIIDKAHIVWFGYYPFNENLIKRKLQIKDNYPTSDKEKGFGTHHLYNRDQMVNINEKKSRTGRSLRDVNMKLYDMLMKMIQ